MKVKEYSTGRDNFLVVDFDKKQVKGKCKGNQGFKDQIKILKEAGLR